MKLVLDLFLHFCCMVFKVLSYSKFLHSYRNFVGDDKKFHVRYFLKSQVLGKFFLSHGTGKFLTIKALNN